MRADLVRVRSGQSPMAPAGDERGRAHRDARRTSSRAHPADQRPPRARRPRPHRLRRLLRRRAPRRSTGRIDRDRRRGAGRARPCRVRRVPGAQRPAGATDRWRSRPVAGLSEKDARTQILAAGLRSGGSPRPGVVRRAARPGHRHEPADRHTGRRAHGRHADRRERPGERQRAPAGRARRVQEAQAILERGRPRARHADPAGDRRLPAGRQGHRLHPAPRGHRWRGAPRSTSWSVSSRPASRSRTSQARTSTTP